jgi:hypothetical protein
MKQEGWGEDEGEGYAHRTDRSMFATEQRGGVLRWFVDELERRLGEVEVAGVAPWWWNGGMDL